MSTEVTLTLSEQIYQRAEAWARRTRKPVSEILTEVIDGSLRPLAGDCDPGNWTDDETLAAADLQMPTRDDSRLSQLLQVQRNGVLSSAERDELRERMHAYEDAILRKSEGLHEAVRRGLRPPLDS
ncbi:MAG: hypothetical protein R3C19_11965 [Planctomycetaceae bacterium]